MKNKIEDKCRDDSGNIKSQVKSSKIRSRLWDHDNMNIQKCTRATYKDTQKLRLMYWKVAVLAIAYHFADNGFFIYLLNHTITELNN